MDIQEYVDTNKDEELASKRQKFLKKKRKNRNLKEVNANLKKQMDKAVGRIIYADLHILELSEMVDDLRAQLEALQPSTIVLN